MTDESGLDICDTLALSCQHVWGSQPSTDKRSTETTLVGRKGTRQNTIHLSRGDKDNSDLADRATCRAGVPISRTVVLSTILSDLVHPAAHFPVRWVLDGNVEMERP